jgi:hypothetical protein
LTPAHVALVTTTVPTHGSAVYGRALWVYVGSAVVFKSPWVAFSAVCGQLPSVSIAPAVTLGRQTTTWGSTVMLDTPDRTVGGACMFGLRFTLQNNGGPLTASMIAGPLVVRPSVDGTQQTGVSVALPVAGQPTTGTANVHLTPGSHVVSVSVNAPVQFQNDPAAATQAQLTAVVVGAVCRMR